MSRNTNSDGGAILFGLVLAIIGGILAAVGGFHHPQITALLWTGIVLVIIGFAIMGVDVDPSDFS